MRIGAAAQIDAGHMAACATMGRQLFVTFRPVSVTRSGPALANNRAAVWRLRRLHRLQASQSSFAGARHAALIIEKNSDRHRAIERSAILCRHTPAL
jgi:hypothetical protein